MLKSYKSIISFISMLLLISSFSFAQEVAETLWSDSFTDTATDPVCLKDVGWMYYGESDGLAGSRVEQTAEGTMLLQTGNFSSFVGAVVAQTNGCPEIDIVDEVRGHNLLVDSTKGMPNSEITFNINFKKLESSFFAVSMRMVQRDTSETYPDSDPTEEGSYVVMISPLTGQSMLARGLGVDEGGAEYDFLNPANWKALIATTDFTVELNVPYWVKFYLYENTYKMKIWEGDLTDEEDVWLLETTEDDFRVSGTFTMMGLVSSDPAATDIVEIDDITVRSTGNSVGVEDDITELPSQYELMANYPNPFNPTTNIQFALPVSSNVKLTVVNALGQVVAELVNGEMSAGIHDVSWNAANMSSGIYFYRVEANDFVQTRKMLLLK
jgi:hypothetical protein